MTPPIERIEVPIRELEALLDQVRSPLGEEGCRKLRGALETLAYLTDLIEDQKTTIQELRQLLSKPASTEKTDKVLENARPKPNNTADTKAPRKPRKGHGRSGAKAYSAASRIRVRHASLASGDCCPKCLKGTLYA